jgi:hypothetical protein
MPDRRVKTIETYLKQCDIGNVQIDDSMVCGFGGCPGHLRID